MNVKEQPLNVHQRSAEWLRVGEKSFVRAFRGAFRSSVLIWSDYALALRNRLDSVVQDIALENRIIHSLETILEETRIRLFLKPRELVIAIPEYIDTLEKLSRYTKDRFVAAFTQANPESWDSFLNRLYHDGNILRENEN
jgi:hypothetical protein